MDDEDFHDYYEALEISANANAQTIERVFRYLARKYHPDNRATADRDRFEAVLKAYGVLRDPEKRARYDIEYHSRSDMAAELAEEVSHKDGVDRDIDIQSKLLSIFYARRRKTVKEPGVGDFELEKLLGCPMDMLDFNLWYLREKRWIVKIENGAWAITAEGVDRVWAERQQAAERKYITDQT
jgi:curved DNA-binding protein CbpA